MISSQNLSGWGDSEELPSGYILGMCMVAKKLNEKRMEEMKQGFKKGDKVKVELTVRKDLTKDEILVIDKTGHSCFLDKSAIIQPFEPREMLVWEKDEAKARQRKVVDKYKDYFIAESEGNTDDLVIWKNAKELPRELENGKVYKNTTNGTVIYKIDNENGFGFDKNGMFFKYSWWEKEERPTWQEYPIEDFKKLLIEEAKKRRFENSDYWIDRKGLEVPNECRMKRILRSNFQFRSSPLELIYDSSVIFKNGVWAKIIE